MFSWSQKRKKSNSSIYKKSKDYSPETGNVNFVTFGQKNTIFERHTSRMKI